MYRAARQTPDVLFVGVDAAAEGLREISQRASRKPARGGISNALFGVLALADAPEELAEIAGALTVILPWGSLLKAVACGEHEDLTRLRRMCRDGAQVRFVFGYGPADASSMRQLGLPSLDGPSVFSTLARGYEEAGFEVTAAELSREAIRDLSTSWSGRLAFSGSERRFVELRGRSR